LLGKVIEEGPGAIRLVGEFDVANVDSLQAALRSHEGPIVVNCSELEFIGIAPLRVLVKASIERGPVVLRHPSRFLCKVISLAGWEDELGHPKPDRRRGASKARSVRQLGDRGDEHRSPRHVA